jgi:hypothetical protein
VRGAGRGEGVLAAGADRVVAAVVDLGRVVQADPGMPVAGAAQQQSASGPADHANPFGQLAQGPQFDDVGFRARFGGEREPVEATAALSDERAAEGAGLGECRARGGVVEQPLQRGEMVRGRVGNDDRVQELVGDRRGQTPAFGAAAVGPVVQPFGVYPLQPGAAGELIAGTVQEHASRLLGNLAPARPTGVQLAAVDGVLQRQRGRRVGTGLVASRDRSPLDHARQVGWLQASHFVGSWYHRKSARACPVAPQR